MTSDQLRAGVLAGVLAAAATIGAVGTFAWRSGSPLRPFVATGRAVAGAGTPATLALLAVGLHLAAAVGWGLLLAALLPRARGLPLLLGAAAVSLLALLVHGWLLPPLRLGFGLATFPLHGAPLVFLHLLYAAGLASGMRLAR